MNPVLRTNCDETGTVLSIIISLQSGRWHPIFLFIPVGHLLFFCFCDIQFCQSGEIISSGYTDTTLGYGTETQNVASLPGNKNNFRGHFLSSSIITYQHQIHTAGNPFAPVIQPIPNRLPTKCSCLIYQSPIWFGNFYDSIIY